MTLPAQDIVERLKEAMKRATPGPWYQTGSPWFRTGSGVLAGSPDGNVAFMIADCESWEGEREEHNENDPVFTVADGDDDAAYIALCSPDNIGAVLDTISRLTVDNEALRKETEAFRSKLAETCGKLMVAESRADALAQEEERLRELVQKAFKDGVLYGTNVDVSDVWQAWLSSKVREELAALKQKDGGNG